MYNFHLIDSEKLFFQIFNNCDNYFVKECKNENFNFNQIEGFDITVTEYGMNGTTEIGKINLNGSHKIELKPYDFKLYMIEF